MKPIKFKEANIVFAENQDEYIPLPAYLDQEDPYGQTVTCWNLTIIERLKLLFKGNLWLTVLKFDKPLQPIKMAVDRPFE